MASHSSEKWLHGRYHVHRLHPTIKHLIWDYSSLNESEEKDYIVVKMAEANKTIVNSEV